MYYHQVLQHGSAFWFEFDIPVFVSRAFQNSIFRREASVCFSSQLDSLRSAPREKLPRSAPSKTNLILPKESPAPHKSTEKKSRIIAQIDAQTWSRISEPCAYDHSRAFVTACEEPTSKEGWGSSSVLASSQLFPSIRTTFGLTSCF